MATKIEKDPKDYEDIIKYMENMDTNMNYITGLIQDYYGKDPIIWRRARTINEKLAELKDLILTKE